MPRGASLRLKDYKSRIAVDGLAGRRVAVDSYKGGRPADAPRGGSRPRDLQGRRAGGVRRRSEAACAPRPTRARSTSSCRRQRESTSTRASGAGERSRRASRPSAAGRASPWIRTRGRFASGRDRRAKETRGRREPGPGVQSCIVKTIHDCGLGLGDGTPGAVVPQYAFSCRKPCRRQPEDLEVEREGPVLDVVEVVLDPLRIEARVAAPAVDLRPAGDAGATRWRSMYCGNFSLNSRDELGPLRARADEATSRPQRR